MYYLGYLIFPSVIRNHKVCLEVCWKKSTSQGIEVCIANHQVLGAHRHTGSQDTGAGAYRGAHPCKLGSHTHL